MLSAIQRWLSPGYGPIGLDLGSHSLRLAQVERVGGELRLIAAAGAAIPPSDRHDFSARLRFARAAIPELLKQSGFRGNRAIVCLPSSVTTVQPLTLPATAKGSDNPKIDEEFLRKHQVDPSRELVRALPLDAVPATGDGRRLLLVRAARSSADELTRGLRRAGLGVVGLELETNAVLDCFTQIFRRATDARKTTCYVSVGWAATSVIVARGPRLHELQQLPIGGYSFQKAVAQGLGVDLEEAARLRVRAAQSPGPETGDPRIQHCVDEIEAELIGRLQDLLRASSESGSAVERIVFIGGEAANARLCARIAGALGLPGQVGDPLVRMGRLSRVGVESGVDRRQVQPGWVVAIGLSMGPRQMAAESVAQAA